MMSRAMRSRQWSCSELAEGNQKLLAVKQETADSTDKSLDLKIEQAAGIVPKLLPALESQGMSVPT